MTTMEANYLIPASVKIKAMMGGYTFVAWSIKNGKYTMHREFNRAKENGIVYRVNKNGGTTVEWAGY